MEAGKVSLQLSDVNLASLLEESVVMVREKALKRNTEILMNIGDIPDRIVADERIVRQILYNLLSNATKFTCNGGSIQVSAGRIHWANGCLVAGDGKRVGPAAERACRDLTTGGEYIEVAVSDTGVGLHCEDLERIFKPFEQADSSFSSEV